MLRQCPNCSLETNLDRCPKCSFPLDEENLALNEEVEELGKEAMFLLEQRKQLVKLSEAEADSANQKTLLRAISKVDEKLRYAQEIFKAALDEQS